MRGCVGRRDGFGRFHDRRDEAVATFRDRFQLYVIYDTVPELEYDGVLGTRTLGGYVELDICRRVLRWDSSR
jgi:hypothetical protein